VKLPYLGIGVTLLALALLLSVTKLPDIAPADFRSLAGDGRALDLESSTAGTRGNRHLRVRRRGGFDRKLLSELLLSAEYWRNDAEGRRRLRSLYWGGAMVGRFVGSALLQKIKTGTLLAVFAATACLLVVTSMLTLEPVAIWSILRWAYSTQSFPQHLHTWH